MLYELGHFREALTYFDKALELEPYAYAYSTLENKGLTQYKLGYYTDALSTLDRALRLNSGDTTALFNKGLVLATLGLGFHTHNSGDLEAALQIMNRVLQIDPNYRDVFSLQALLIQLLT